MFQVGDIVQVIIVPKKYKQYDIAGATGVVKTVYSNNIRIHISSYYNEESEEGDFYFKENELNNFTRKENDMSIIELWEKRSIEKIDKEAEIKLMELLAEDEYTHDLILHMNDLKDAGFKVEIPNNIYDMTSDYTRGMRTKRYWKALVRWLPNGWLQTRTLSLNYENLRSMYFQRKSHKLTEWHQFCDWILTLPYAKELITYTKENAA